MRRHRTEANTISELKRIPDLRVAGDEDTQIAPGTIVGGKFRLERVLGQGGMGVVVAATHLELDERVALKFLKPKVQVNDAVIARFTREARSAVKLKSEHVARVLDVGTHEGAPFMVMEYLEGSDLGSTIVERAPLGVAETTEYVIQACEGLAEAHARGIVHRDIKPENLFVTFRSADWPILKVLDFGISKAALTGVIGGVDLSTHETTSLMGSPYYMSPEQLRSTKNVDRRADIWSLGVVMYELLSGELPFSTELEFTALVAAILELEPPPLGAIRPDIPPMLEAIVHRCLEKAPEKRFQTTAELAIALLEFAPKRARTAADRAVRWARSGGGAEKLSLPPSIPPTSSARATRMLSQAERAARSNDTTRSFRAPEADVEPVVEPARDPEAPKSRVGWILMGGIILGLVVLAIVLAWPAMRNAETAHPSSAPTGSAPPALPTSGGTSGVASTATAPTSSTPAAAASGAPAPTAAASAAPHSTPVVKPVKSAAPVASGLEIHKTR